MNNQESEFLPEIPSLISQDEEKMEINNEFPDNDEKNEAQQQLKEEDKVEVFLDNEIENTIFSKPIVSKMNANNINQGESKVKAFENQKEIEEKVEESEKIAEVEENSITNNEKKQNNKEEFDDKNQKKIEKKVRRKSIDDVGLNYNENPLDYLFPKEKEKITDSPNKKINKDCENEFFHRNLELSKSFGGFSDKKEDRTHANTKNPNPLSTSFILDNKKYKIVLRKSWNLPGFFLIKL